MFHAVAWQAAAHIMNLALLINMTAKRGQAVSPRKDSSMGQ